MSQGDPTGTCIYECINGVYTLTGGNPPPGYRCPPTLGVCNTPGSVVHIAPQPIDGPLMLQDIPDGGGEPDENSSGTSNPNSNV